MVKYSIVLPCKDEESTIRTVILKAREAIPDAQIIVVDNNCSDDTAKIARACGAMVVKESIQGYGAALLRGFSEAKGDYIIMCDADDTYDLLELPSMMKYVRHAKGRRGGDYDIILGNRLNNRMKKDAMPLLHKYIGNPFLGFVMCSMFGAKIKDAHSGLRIMKRESLEALGLESSGMELASEMLIKATKLGMKIKEVDITYHPRIGASKLDSFNDGWKHLKMMMLYSPDHLFLMPGLIALAFGMIILLAMIAGPIMIFGLKMDIHPTIIGSILTISGYQLIMLWLFAQSYRINIMGEKSRFASKVLGKLTLEKSIVFGGLAVLAGIGLASWIIISWIRSDYGSLFELRKAIFALTLILIGMQTIYSGFMISILGIKRSAANNKIIR